MVVIEDKGKLRFLKDGKEISQREGLKQLESIYNSEPQETKKVIDRLRNKYRKV